MLHTQKKVHLEAKFRKLSFSCFQTYFCVQSVCAGAGGGEHICVVISGLSDQETK